jgi:hypothetical protein
MLYLVLYLIKYTTTYIDLVRREEKQVLMMITIKFDLNRYSCSWGAGGAFGGNRGLRPIPPEKGIFPLDHLHECDAVFFNKRFSYDLCLVIFLFIHY